MNSFLSGSTDIGYRCGGREKNIFFGLFGDGWRTAECDSAAETAEAATQWHSIHPHSVFYQQVEKWNRLSEATQWVSSKVSSSGGRLFAYFIFSIVKFTRHIITCTGIKVLFLVSLCERQWNVSRDVTAVFTWLEQYVQPNNDASIKSCENSINI